MKKNAKKPTNSPSANGTSPNTTMRKKIKIGGEKRNERQKTDNTPVRHAAKNRMVRPDDEVADSSKS